MSEPLSVAVVWHMHQPYYRDDVRREMLLPWVRLRASKDYSAMIRTVREHPELRVTMNMVPSLLRQLDLYGRGEAHEPHRELCLRPVDRITPAERRYLVDLALRTGFTQKVGLFSGLARLLDRLRRTSDPDDRLLVDLQVWWALAWIDPVEVAADAELAALAARGEGFTATERDVVYARQDALVAGVIPAYRDAVAAGQIEPMTSPAYHPILPLLIDQTSARQASPGLALPRRGFGHPGDADEQLTRGLARFEELVGLRPQGMWPSECAVSEAAAQRMGAAGVTWSISDENVLARSLDRSVRDGRSGLPDLYRPHQVAGGPVMVFRDALLSNRIGFEYQNWETPAAVEDLIRCLEAIADRTEGPALAVIALDGENCWDAYPENGAPFLDHLYRALTGNPRLRSSHVSRFLAEHPEAVAPLPRLWAGSWIDADFRTWIGEPAHNRAWDRLADARQAIDDAGGPDAHPGAFEEVLVAEGSDFCWWFGRHHSSGMDSAWDALYRTHLANVHRLLNEEPPPILSDSILGNVVAGDDLDPLQPLESGDVGSPAWLAAGVVPVPEVFGSMRPPRGGVDRIEWARGRHGLTLRCGTTLQPTLKSLRLHVRAAGHALDITIPSGSARDTSLGDAVVVSGPDMPLTVTVQVPDDAIEWAAEIHEDGRGWTRLPASGWVESGAVREGSRRIVVAAVELSPLLMVGGLGRAVADRVADAVYAGHHVVALIPAHPTIIQQGWPARPDRVQVGDQMVTVFQGRLPGLGVSVLALSSPPHFERRQLYGNPDDAERFAFFSRAVLAVCDAFHLAPDVVHCHEWHTALIPLLMGSNGHRRPLTVLSLHRPEVRPLVASRILTEIGIASGGGNDVDLCAVAERVVNRRDDGGPLDYAAL